MSYWDQRTTLAYKQMLKRHVVLWRYIEQFIKDSDIESVLEVGCGLESPVKDWVEIHTGIDLNEKTDALHKDFTLMEPYEVLRHDLLLACGVIEHCDGYANFLRQVKSFNYTHTLITFFCGLDRDEDVFNLHPDGYIINKYSQEKVENVLNEFGLNHQFVSLTPHDDVLLIVKDNAHLTCEDCRESHERVQRTTCPYPDQIGVEVMAQVSLCKRCEERRRGNDG